MLGEFVPQSVVGRVVHADEAVEVQLGRAPIEVCPGDAVAEHVVHPAQRRRAGGDIDARFQQPLVVAVARAEQDVMLAERHGLPIAVGGLMADGEDRQSYE